jgi:hypothetical protein
MKHRYIVVTYVEASSPVEALKSAKSSSPHEVYLDKEVWKGENWALREEDKKKLGFE